MLIDGHPCLKGLNPPLNVIHPRLFKKLLSLQSIVNPKRVAEILLLLEYDQNREREQSPKEISPLFHKHPTSTTKVNFMEKISRLNKSPIYHQTPLKKGSKIPNNKY